MRWVVVLLLAIVGAFMLFDGVRALTLGDYLTPTSGLHAGQLGPWSQVVEARGIPARSIGMKVAFVALGSVHLLAATALVVARESPASWLVVVVAVTGLWYLPFGTIADLAVLAIVGATSLRPWG